jgi:ribosomal protein S8
MTNQKIRLINIVNNSKNCGNKTFSVLKTDETLRYLNILYKEGVVVSFFVDKTFIVVTVSSNISLTSNNQIKFLLKKKVKNNKKYEDLIKQPYTMQTLYLSTSQGILPIKDVKRKKLGGYPFILV